MSDAQKLIADVLTAHRGDQQGYCASCDLWMGNQRHAEHVAAEINKALGGLTVETRTNPMSSSGMTTNYNTGEITSYSDIRRDQRWVSDWSEAQP